MPFTTSIIRSWAPAQATIAVELLRPPGFSFAAGQSIDLTFLQTQETDLLGATRSFSIASAPSERTLLIATRERESAFKRQLATAPAGSAFSFEGPFGGMTLPEKLDTSLVCLAGGIGITPFRSMAVEWATQKLSYPLTIFYSNQEPNKAPFLDELRELASAEKKFTFVPTMTRAGDSWNGEHGRIDRKMLLKYAPSIATARWYLAGTLAFVGMLKSTLVAMEVPRKNILNEPFDGY